MKPIIYQLFPRWFANSVSNPVPNGTIEQNGCGKLEFITTSALKSIKRLGVTHVWYTGVIEHSTTTDYSRFNIRSSNPHIVKGKAGSPYSIRDYFDIDPDLAVDVTNRMHEFEELVARTHKAGLKVIIDFVPNHLAREYFSDAKPAGVADFGENDDTGLAFSPSNNFYYLPGTHFSPSIDLGTGDNAYSEFPAKVTGNDCFSPSPSINDWYETVKLNYGVDYASGQCHFSPIPDTWHKMLTILLYWADKGIDAFRCDMVFMVPLDFWHWAIAQVKEKYPHIQFIAEIYDVALYRPFITHGGFDYLYDKVTLYDTLRDVLIGYKPASALTSCWQTVDGINSHMLCFLENHDEQRIASPQFLGDAAKALPAIVVAASISTAPFMLYSGQELGEPATDAEGFSGRDGRTSIFDYWSVDSLRRWFNNGKFNTARLTPNEKKLRQTYSRILNLCNREPAIAQGAFYDLMYVNYDNIGSNNVFAYLRHYGSDTILVVANFGHNEARVNLHIPEHAFSFLNIATGEYHATELLSANEATVKLSSEQPFNAIVPPHNAVLWKIIEK